MAHASVGAPERESRHQTLGLTDVLAAQSGIDLELRASVLSRNPTFDPAKSHSPSVHLTKANAETQRVAVGTLLCEIRVFPEFDHKAALSPAASLETTGSENGI